MNMNFSGSLRDGDVHLKYPQVIEEQLKRILEQGSLKVSDLRVADRKVPKFSGRGASIHQAMLHQAAKEQSEGMNEIRLNEGDFEHVQKVLITGFADSSLEWALQAYPSEWVGIKTFSYIVERRSERPSTADAPGLTKWFDARNQEVPGRTGVYEGINELNPIVRNSDDHYGFYHWDGTHWGERANGPEWARPRAMGFPPGPRFWRGRTSA